MAHTLGADERAEASIVILPRHYLCLAVLLLLLHSDKIQVPARFMVG